MLIPNQHQYSAVEQIICEHLFTNKLAFMTLAMTLSLTLEKCGYGLLTNCLLDIGYLLLNNCRFHVSIQKSQSNKSERSRGGPDGEWNDKSKGGPDAGNYHSQFT